MRITYNANRHRFELTATYSESKNLPTHIWRWDATLRLRHCACAWDADVLREHCHPATIVLIDRMKAPLLAVTNARAKERAAREQVEREIAAAMEARCRAELARAQALTPPTVAAIEDAIAALAADDTDWATASNCVGFSASDTRLGHRLAASLPLSPLDAVRAQDLVARYRRQLPVDLYELATVGMRGDSQAPATRPSTQLADHYMVPGSGGVDLRVAA